MTEVFTYLLSFFTQSSIVIAAVIIIRLLLRKAPKWLICSLWALAAIPLLFPVRIESIFSLIPRSESPAQPVEHYSTGVVSELLPKNTQMLEASGEAAGTGILPGATAVADAISNITLMVYTIIWLLGIIIMLVYAAVSYLRLYRMVKESVRSDEGFYLCDRISSPFVLGLIQPKIYLPSNISEHDEPYILAHERAHIRRRDHLWKPLGFLLLSVYWYNPLLWAAYILLCRDIESACDEKVISELGAGSKKPYAIALVNATAPRRLIAACPVAFGETSVKSRVKNVLNYKKPALWIIIVATVLSIAVAVCFLTNPVSHMQGGATGDHIAAGYVWSRAFSDDYGYSSLTYHVINYSDKTIAIDYENAKLYKNGELLKPKESEYRVSGYGYVSISPDSWRDLIVNLWNYEEQLDTQSEFCWKADYYELIRKARTDDENVDFREGDIGERLGDLSIVFRFPNKDLSGEVTGMVNAMANADIDGDGSQELIVLSPDPTSGIYSIAVGAYDPKTHLHKYSDTVMPNFYNVSLEIVDGQVILSGIGGDNESGSSLNTVKQSYNVKCDGTALQTELISTERKPHVDLSDIDTLYVQTDLPKLVYADNDDVYLDGDCGIVRYNLRTKQIVDRLSLDYLHKCGFQITHSHASPDGKQIYINDYADYGNGQHGEPYHRAVYHIDQNLITIENATDENVFKLPPSDIFQFGYPEEGNDAYTRTYIDSQGKTYTLSVPGWAIRNTKLTIIDKDSSEKSYMIFQ